VHINLKIFYRFFILLGLCSSNAVLAQQIVVHVLEEGSYKGHQKPYTANIAWSDFRGVLAESDQWYARSYTSFGYKLNLRKKDLATTVILKTSFFFDMNNSQKKNGELSAELLRHEQGHIDIAWYIYHQYCDSLRAHHFTSYLTAEREASAIFQQFQVRVKSLQEQYDSATNHSTISAEQDLWNQKIAQMLQELEQNTKIP
jgi:hypothetical protein